MTVSHRLRSWLLGLALGVFLTLLISPATRWLVRAQVAAAGLTVLTPDVQGRQAEDARAAVIARHPQDFPIQLAAALSGPSAQVVQNLRALVPRFGGNPSLYANLLRFEIGSPPNPGSAARGTGVYLSRAEDWALGSQPPPKDYRAPPPPDPKLLALYDADAAAGERLDAGNAFFPLMRAAGLFAAHRDAEGQAAVLRAGQKSAWREYTGDEMNGRLRLADALYGHGSALARIAVVAAVLFPHYAALRGAARVSIAQAAQAEAAGQTGRGLAIREAILHSGSLMRAQSTSFIGSLVGIAIAALATARPGGVPAPAYDSHLTNEQRTQRRLQAFSAYAGRLGHPEVARQAQAESAASEVVRGVLKKAEDRSILSPPQLLRLGVLWLCGLATLANAWWLLVFGAMAAGLSRLPSVPEGKPLAPLARRGVLAVLLVTLAATLYCFVAWHFLVWLALMGMAMVAWLAVWLMRGTRENWPDRRHRAGQFFGGLLLTAGGLLVLGGLATWQARGVVGFADAVRMLTDVTSSDGAAAGDMPQEQETEVVTILVSLALPLLMLLVLSLVGRARRVPVSVALVRGFRAAALPTACLLVVLYGALTLATLRQERQMDDGLRQMVQHEGRYYASLAGQPWPGPIP